MPVKLGPIHTQRQCYMSAVLYEVEGFSNRHKEVGDEEFVLVDVSVEGGGGVVCREFFE